MIEGFERGALVILNLVNPKEKFFGILAALSPAGVTVRAINLDSFDDWIHQIARDEDPDLDLMTMFVPLFRVDRFHQVLQPAVPGGRRKEPARVDRVIGILDLGFWILD